jgi:[acyl-carrier-protein] S-malonyltransferase
MSAALLFPGLDAVFVASKLKRWLSHESTSASLAEASRLLSALSGQKEDLAGFLEKSGRPHIADFDRTLIALTALQIGIVRAIATRIEWDILLGCSHGDVARSVIAGVLTYDQAILLLWTFATLRKDAPKGCTANVRTVDGTPLSLAHFEWLAAKGAPISVWSDKNATIAGTVEHMDAISGEGRENGLKIRPVLSYPVHSPVMQPAADALRAIGEGWPLAEPKGRIFSSVWVRFLKGPEDIREEGLAGAVQPIRWVETLKHLHLKEGVSHFINVGPSNTLTGWLFESEDFAGTRLTDGWDLLNPQ